MQIPSYVARRFGSPIALAGLAYLLLAASAGGQVFNVAAGKPVTLQGVFGIRSEGDPSNLTYPPAPPGSLVDEVLVPEGTYWRSGTAWWNEAYPGSAGNTIGIDLQGRYQVTGVTMQCDGNDTYRIEGRGIDGNWVALCDIAATTGSGVRSRPVVWLASPAIATAVRVRAIVGDVYCSISEIQVWGVLPGTPFNAAVHRPVTLEGAFGVIGTAEQNPRNLPGTDVYPLASAVSLVDGIYRPASVYWQSGTVWWNAAVPESQANAILIDLQGSCVVSGITIQCDGNDTYHVEGRIAPDTWVALCDVPVWPGYAMLTRPMIPVTTHVPVDMVRFTYSGGDLYTSVSEIAVWAVAAGGSANVAAGKPVTPVGTFGIIGSDNPDSFPDASVYPLPAVQSVTDNVFRPERTQWQDGTVWWNERSAGSQGNSLLIDLEGTYQVCGLIVQCDGDETFRVEGHTLADTWIVLGSVPVDPNWGVMTRRPIAVPWPVVVDQIRFSALSGDLYNSVSEIQAWGVAVVAGDIDGDSHVDVVDLLNLAGAWASSAGLPGYECGCDLNADGSVDVVDLLILAEAWGT